MTQSAPTVTDRHQRILERVVAEGSARASDLAHEFGVHQITVRRDIDALADLGLLEPIHGGARIHLDPDAELAYPLRAAQRVAEKERIARAALDLIADGETVAIDASTTGLALVNLLHLKRVHAIVTGLDAANALATSGVAFTLIGGAHHPGARSFVGAVTSAGLKRFNPDRVFFSSKGFTLEHGFTDAHLPEVEAKAQLIHAAAQKVALLDHTKFGVRGAHRVLETARVDVLITDDPVEPALRAALRRAGVYLVVARRSASAEVRAGAAAGAGHASGSARRRRAAGWAGFEASER